MPEPAAPVRVLIADDHLLFRDGLAVLLQRQPGIAVVAVASDGAEALESCRALAPDVALVDLRMPKTDGIALISALRAACPQVRAVVLSGFDADDDVVQAIRAGARGYLLKTTYPAELAEAIAAVHRGDTWLPPAVAAKLASNVGRPRLTHRQGEVLALIAEGLTNEQIGQRLTIVEGTVKAHVKSILEKLGARDRTQALCIALQRGLVRSA
jgi:two-component system NarL family response regulator